MAKKASSRNSIKSNSNFSFAAVVVGVIVLIAIVVLFRGGLTGQYHKALDNSDSLRQTDLTFTPVNMIFDGDGFNGPVAAMRISVTPQSMYFDFSNYRTYSVYVVLKQLNSTALQTGAIVYYNGGWQVASRDKAAAKLAVYGPKRLLNETQITFNFKGSGAQGATEVTAILLDKVQGTLYGEWQVKWKLSPTAFQSIAYKSSVGGITKPNLGFETNAGNILREANSGRVLIQYLYDAGFG